MPFDYSIRIEGEPGAPARFVPQGGSAGEPLRVRVSDTVSWGNATDEGHQPWPTDAAHNLLEPPDPSLSNPIPPHQPSNPAWIVNGGAGTTIYYRCKTHPDREEFGSIQIEPTRQRTRSRHGRV